jgi:hypothetical protein
MFHFEIMFGLLKNWISLGDIRKCEGDKRKGHH